MLTNTQEAELVKFSAQIKIEVLRMISTLGIGHLGGSLSVTDLLAVLYGKHMNVDPKNPTWEDRDWLVMSKGHAGPAVYAALALKGFFAKDELLTLNQPGTRLPSHCDRSKTKGIDMTTGSLGQGASTAAGIALAHKLDNKTNNVYVVFGDGECNEGQIWEMAMFASHFKLHNIIAFIDYNNMQLDGTNSEVMDIGDVSEKFRQFGWFAQDVDGHNIAQIDAAITIAKNKNNEMPNIIALHTIKGHGWKAIENKASNHSMTVSKSQFEDAKLEIITKIQQLLGGEFNESDYS